MPSVDSYAVVRVDGCQILARPRAVIRVPHRSESVGKAVTLNDVLLLHKDKKVTVGQPVVKDAKVLCQVKGHGRGTKIIVYHFKRRKRVRKKQGHRQDYTDLLIKEIKEGA